MRRAALAFAFALCALPAASQAPSQPQPTDAPPATAPAPIDNSAFVTTAHEPKEIAWSFDGPFGTYDRAALRRGFQVFRDVCSACHSLKLLSYRHLGDEGGPEFSAEEVKAIAAGYQVPDVDDIGEPAMRPATPLDHFVPPQPNEKAQRAANNGALPPDLSVIVKAREGGANYLYSLLTGFAEEPPTGFGVGQGLYYNPYFEGWQIAMAPPLTDGQVTYDDGTTATVDQMARDAVQFLAWAAEPKMEARKSLGFKIVLFLIAFATLLYFVKRKVWHGVDH